MADVNSYILPAVVAGAATTSDIGIVEGHGSGGFAVGEMRLVTRTAQAAQGVTNYVVINVQYTRAGAAPVVLGTLDLSVTALVQDIPAKFVLPAGTLEKSVLKDGDVIQLATVHTGTGGALAAGALLELERE